MTKVMKARHSMLALIDRIVLQWGHDKSHESAPSWNTSSLHLKLLQWGHDKSHGSLVITTEFVLEYCFLTIFHTLKDDYVL